MRLRYAFATLVIVVASFLLGQRCAVEAQLPTREQGQQQVQRELGLFARLARELKPTVVNIQVTKSRPGMPIPELFMEPRQPREGQGSGVIVSPDGYVLTNHHVVDGAREIRVVLHDDTELKGRVVGTDPNTDLAVLKLDAPTPLPAARLGDSDAMEVGDWVMAIGNPFGLEETVTVGVLSGRGRSIGAGPYDDFLQTDAAINPGNSGGPLFNTGGELVGINTAIFPAGQGIGFAIPVNLAREVMAQLQSQGRVVRGYVGVGIARLTPEARRELKLPATLEGALVDSVVPGGPADAAGARPDDVVVALNGRPVESDRDLLNQVARVPVGSTASLRVLRAGKELTLKVQVAERPDEETLERSRTPRFR
ncbi:MAG: trypsin-like peptidase domain-containing protein [Candidatus Eremiobacterota bacterium]